MHLDKPLPGSRFDVLRILLVEDSDFDCAIIAQVLSDAGMACSLVRVQTGKELRLALETRYDLILTDLSLPGFGDTGVLDIVRQYARSTPVIIVSGTVDDAGGVAAMRQGVVDYLLKDRLARLPQAVASAVERAAAPAQAHAGNRSLELLQAREHERQLLCKDLHDEFGQRLAMLKLCLNHIGKFIADGSDAAGAWRDADETVAGLVAQIRALSGALRPESLSSLGLEPAIRQLLQNHFAHSGMACDFEFAGVPDQLDDAIKLTAFRIVQEGITNVVRHSHATRVVVEISSGGGDEELEVIVRDNGVGINRCRGDQEEAGRRLGGLSGMRERVELLGGQLKASGTPEQGTRVVASIPLKAAR
jgi:signal transduction histidine kinase